MKKRVIGFFTAFIVASTFSINAQESSYIKHRVNRGETVSKIARDYDVSVKEIFEYNPEAKNGIKENTFILIPKKGVSFGDVKAKPEVVTELKTHIVEPKQTLYSIAKKYNITVRNLYDWNPGLKENGLKAGQTINVVEDKTISELQEKINNNSAIFQEDLKMNKKIPASTIDTIKDIHNVNYIIVKVAPKVTLYGLAVEYNTTIQRIIELNPELKDQGLKIDSELKIPTPLKKGIGNFEKNQIKKIQNEKNKNNLINIIVEPKQTIYSITKQYGISPKELLDLNPDLKYGLKVGMELLVPNKSITKDVQNNNIDYSVREYKNDYFSDLTRSLDKRYRKELVLLLPFNVKRLGLDIDKKLMHDSFLNMTLDFYSGALLAIDEAKHLGLPLDVKFFDSNETKTSSDINSIFSKEDLSNVDVIIGPFFQKNVDLAVNKLPNSKVVLVSPLSNEKANVNGRIVQTMPYSDVLKRKLINYFIDQNANIVVVLDEKNTSTRNFLNRNYPAIRILNANEANKIDAYLSVNSKNAIILDSNSIEATLITTEKLSEKINSFNIQLAAFEKNDVFEHTEININTLVDLKLLYPSVINENETDKGNSFSRAYKALNNIYPSRYATRGYDVTLDVILRMFQDNGFLESIDKKSQQTENMFIYSENTQENMVNSGVYLLQYDENLTLKVI